MNKFFFKILIIFVSIFFVQNCNKKNNVILPEIKDISQILIEDADYNKQQGIDCHLPDSLRTNCAKIKFVYPQIISGSEALKQSVKTWSEDFLSNILSSDEETYKMQLSVKDLDGSANSFFQNHEHFKGSVMYGAFVAKSNYRILLNDKNFLTLEIDAYTFQGGAHGNPSIALATFRKETGKILKIEDIVTNEDELKKIAEKKIKMQRADIFKQGFKFDDIFNFVLPKNVGLLKNGLLLKYQVYEVMPYAYGETSLKITFKEIKSILKIK